MTEETAADTLRRELLSSGADGVRIETEDGGYVRFLSRAGYLQSLPKNSFLRILLEWLRLLKMLFELRDQALARSLR